MSLLDKLERKIGKAAPTNITIYLIAGQTIFYVLAFTGQLDREMVYLNSGLVLEGQWWRLVTFLFDPPIRNPLFALFAWYLFYLMGSALEEHWGEFRYTAYLLIGYVLTVAVSFLVPGAIMSNAFLAGSVFLAFAFLFPDFEILLFFILPVRIKWLALITWVGYGYQLLFGFWSTRLLVLSSVANFLIFFGKDLVQLVRYGQRTMARKAASVSRRPDEPFHRCTVCGITDKTHPQMDFRYCPSCAGQRGYCREHLFNHEHRSDI